MKDTKDMEISTLETTATDTPKVIDLLAEYAEQQQPPVTDWQAVAEAQAKRLAHLEDVIATSKRQPLVPHQNRDARPPQTAEQLRKQWGELRYLHTSTREEKIAAFGENPATVSDTYLKACFGKGNSGAEVKELMLRDPLKYRTLREIAKTLNIYGA